MNTNDETPGASAGEAMPTITPQVLPDTATAYLVCTASDRDGAMWFYAAQDEEQARSALANFSTSRFAAVVKVPVSRALLNERWKEAPR